MSTKVSLTIVHALTIATNFLCGSHRLGLPLCSLSQTLQPG